VEPRSIGQEGDVPVRGVKSCGVWAAFVMVLAGASVTSAQLGARTTTDPAPVSLGYGPHAPTEIESRPLGGAPPKQAVEAKPLASDPAAKSGAGRGGVLWPLAGVLTLVVIAGAGARALARRSGGLGAALGAGGRAPAGVLEILGRYPAARGATLVLLKLDRRVLLLSQSAGGRLGAGAGFSTLCEVTDPEEVASILVKTRDADGDSMAERFRSLLTRFDGDMSRADAGGESTPSRRVVGSSAGDRAELWDERTGAIPVVDLTARPGPGGSMSMLRKRLASLGGRGAA
jgi:hypothetical protein